MADEPTQLSPEATELVRAYANELGPDAMATQRALRDTLAEAKSSRSSGAHWRSSNLRRGVGIAVGVAAAGLLAVGGASAAMLLGQRLPSSVGQAAQMSAQTTPSSPAHQPVASTTRASSSPALAPNAASTAAPNAASTADTDGTEPAGPTEPSDPSSSVDGARDQNDASKRAHTDKRAGRAASSKVRTTAPSAPSTPAASPTTHTANSLNEERELLARAQRALARGDHERALTYTSRHAARFPTGILEPERLAIQATALCQAGDVEAGLERVSELERKTPGAPSITRARKACQ